MCFSFSTDQICARYRPYKRRLLCVVSRQLSGPRLHRWTAVLAGLRSHVCHLIQHLPNSTAPICPLQHDLIGTALACLRRTRRVCQPIIIVTDLQHAPKMPCKTWYYSHSSQNLLLWLVWSAVERLPACSGSSASSPGHSQGCNIWYNIIWSDKSWFLHHKLHHIMSFQTRIKCSALKWALIRDN